MLKIRAQHNYYSAELEQKKINSSLYISATIAA
jgi:hypothetical protein